MTRISYGGDAEIMRYTDESVEKPGTLYGVYDGDLISGTADGTWNKEHVWPCSQMKEGGVDPRHDSDTKNHATDLQNFRVSCQNSNGKHGNKFYDVADSDIAFFPNIASDGSSNHAFEGDFRGYVARVCFYMALRYNFLNSPTTSRTRMTFQWAASPSSSNGMRKTRSTLSRSSGTAGSTNTKGTATPSSTPRIA